MIINGKIIKNVPIEKFNQDIKDKKVVTNNKSDFNEILNKKINDTKGIKISKHAQIRIEERDIKLTDELKLKVSNAIERAEKKGVKDSLVVVDENAFIVNIKNKTIITAFGKNELKESVFTNIDGAVISD